MSCVAKAFEEVGRTLALAGAEWRDVVHITSYHVGLKEHADAIVRRLSEESGFEREVWQFPVVVIPLGIDGAPDSVVLRPIHSVDGMTAQVVRMPDDLLNRMADQLLAVDGISGVFYDLTHKPPGTIEWE